MKVVIYEINKGTKSHYFGLKNAESGQVLYACPMYRTIAGICKWAFKHGYLPIDVE